MKSKFLFTMNILLCSMLYSCSNNDKKDNSLNTESQLNNIEDKSDKKSYINTKLFLDSLGTKNTILNYNIEGESKCGSAQEQFIINETQGIPYFKNKSCVITFDKISIDRNIFIGINKLNLTYSEGNIIFQNLYNTYQIPDLLILGEGQYKLDLKIDKIQDEFDITISNL